MSDTPHSHDPDGLSEFASESAPAADTGADTPAADTTAFQPRDLHHLPSSVGVTSPPVIVVCAGRDADDEDWLSLFETESVCAPAPAPLASVPVTPARSPHPEPARSRWSRSAIVRLAAASVAACVAGAVSVLWGLHALNPASTGALDRGADEKAVSLPAPSVEPGISASALGQFNKVAVAAPRFTTPSATLPVAPRGTSGMAAPRTTPTSRMALGASRENAAPAPRTDRSAAAATSAQTRLVIPGGAGEELLPETLRTPLGTEAAFAPAPRNRRDASAEASAVRQTLHSYEAAYEGLDVAATAAVWPSVDRRALARAFDTLKSQGLNFQSCVIDVADTRATANCRGTLQFVRKVGNPIPLTAEQQWVFKMRRLDGDWKIDEVSASQTPLLTAQRIRGEE